MTDFHGKLVLSATPSTLRIPLAARALGGNLFPQLAVDDRHAAHTLAAIGDTGLQWLRDRQSVYGVLARTHSFRDQARAFLAHTPSAHVVNLGCGLSDYLQWLDNGQMRMTDADLPEVMTFRRALLPPQHDRHQLVDLDLNDPDWWTRLGLPESKSADPVLLFSEGVFMYLSPATVASILQVFGERAPAGSLLILDVMCWLAIGRAKHHTSVRRTGAEFHWGPRRLTELTRPHHRLTLKAVYPAMQGYNLFHKVAGPVFQAATGVPLYAVYTLGVQDART